MNETKLTQIRDENANLVEEMKRLATEMEANGSQTKVETVTRFDECEAQKQINDNEIAALERVEKAKLLNVKRSEVFGAPLIKVKRGANQKDVDNAFRAFALADHRPERIRDAWKRSADMLDCNWNSIEFVTRADQASDVDATGGYADNDSLFKGLVEARKRYGGIESVATVLVTDNGNPLHFSTVDDTAAAAVLSAQNVSVASVDVAYGKVSLGVYDIKTGNYKVSLDLIEDAGFDVAGFTGRALGTRIARKCATYFTTGTGSSQPTGIMQDSTSGKTAISDDIDPEDLYSLYFSVDAEYRDSPSCCWMMNSATLKSLMISLSDSEGAPLWGAGLNEAPGAVILGKRVVINEAMDSMVVGTPKKPIVFGDMSAFHIRRVGQTRILRDNSRYIDYLAVGFFAYDRVDSKLVDAGTHPVKHIATGATSGT